MHLIDIDVVSVALRRKRAAEAEALRLHHAQQVATLAGERDAALREGAELRATVAGLEARLNQAIDDRMFYYELFQDTQKGV